MKKFLIVYATTEGQTEKIATTIKKHLVKFKAKVHIHNAKEKLNENIKDFDFILCGGSLHAGKIQKELVNFINKNKKVISDKPNAIFLVSLVAASQSEKIRKHGLDAIHKKIGLKFKKAEMIAGALKHSKYNWFQKRFMKFVAKCVKVKNSKQISIKKDYEYTDWKQVESFAKGLIK